jgi:hypothetical protein
VERDGAFRARGLSVSFHRTWALRGFGAAAGFALVLALSPGASAETFPLFEGQDSALVFEEETQSLTLDATFPALEPPDLVAAALASIKDPKPPDPTVLAPPGRRPNKRRATIISTAVLVLSAVASSSTIWRHGYEPFNFHNEFWFGKHTYAGGADKASHLVLYNALARELQIGYYRMNYSRDQAELMAFLTSMGAGLATEVGDAFTVFGFSYEDLVLDAAGAATAILVSRNGLDDLIGFRFGPVPNQVPQPCCPVNETGKDYSEEIYTADLKIPGLARRMKFDPGPARFLLVSMTYGSKGYKNSLPQYREQQIGIEVGINFPEILTAVGVRDTTWWGRCLFIFFNLVRIPYTQIGYRYDFIHHQWWGPNIGQEYDPGPGVAGGAGAPARRGRR